MKKIGVASISCRLAGGILVAGLLLATGCGLVPPPAGQRAHDLATVHGWRKLTLDTGLFTLTGFVKGEGGNNTDLLVVYIEGDGRAWRNRFQISSDPTPVHPVAFELAVSDPASMVLYLARPCQYGKELDGDSCQPQYWAQDRFAPEVVAAMSTAIDQVMARTGARKLALVGFSGGGAVAALLSGERADVVSLFTVAAPLDHRAWTEAHRVLPLSGSLNPVDRRAILQHIPQVHFVGGRDRIVPEEVVQGYATRIGDRSMIRVFVEEDFAHDCCWAESWPVLLERARAEIAGMGGRRDSVPRK